MLIIIINYYSGQHHPIYKACHLTKYQTILQLDYIIYSIYS